MHDQLANEQKAAKQAKRNRIDIDAIDTEARTAKQNLDSRAGLAVNGALLQRNKRSDAARLQDKADTAERAAKTAEKNALAFVENRLVAAPILSSLAGIAQNEYTGALQKHKKAELEAVVRYLKHKYNNAKHTKLKLAATGKNKAQLVALIVAALCQLTGAVQAATDEYAGLGAGGASGSNADS